MRLFYARYGSKTVATRQLILRNGTRMAEELYPIGLHIMRETKHHGQGFHDDFAQFSIGFIQHFSVFHPSKEERKEGTLRRTTP